MPTKDEEDRRVSAAKAVAYKKIRDVKVELERARKILLSADALNEASYLHKAIAELAKAMRGL